MPTSSARPNQLTGFAMNLRSRVDHSGDGVDTLTRSMARYRAGCGAAAPIAGIDWIARNRLDRARTLATSVSQIAQAFTDADRSGNPGGGGLVGASDAALATAIADRSPGLMSGVLLAPQDSQGGRDLATAFREMDGEEAAERAALLPGALASEAMAAGFVNELGTNGLVGLYESIVDARRSYEISSAEFDRAMVGLSGAFALAGGSKAPPAGTTSSSAYALDLAIIDGLGDTAEGQMLVRHVAVTGTSMAAPLVAHLAGAAFHGRSPASATEAAGSAELRDRLAALELPPSMDLPVLELLAADPRAAELYEAGSASGYSRIATHLTRRNGPELEVVADIMRGRYIEPVAAGRAAAWEHPQAGVAPTATQLRTDAALDGALGAVQGMDDPPRSTSLLLVDLVDTHPAFFDDAIADQDFQELGPDPRLQGFFEVIARQPDALDRATALVVERSGAQAEASIGRLDPADVAADRFRVELDAPRQVGHYVEDGALAAGQRHDAVAGFGVGTANFVANKVLGKGASRAGPAAMLGSYLVKPWINLGATAAKERYVDTNDRLDEAPARSMDRSLPYVAAVAMANDDRWAPLLTDPEALRDLDVVGSDAGWESFSRWIGQQPPVVRDTLHQLISQHDPTN